MGIIREVLLRLGGTYNSREWNTDYGTDAAYSHVEMIENTWIKLVDEWKRSHRAFTGRDQEKNVSGIRH